MTALGPNVRAVSSGCTLGTLRHLSLEAYSADAGWVRRMELACISEVLGYNLGGNIEYPDTRLPCFSSVTLTSHRCYL
jgi:hypothetical protein